jgi:TolA-binding protein
MKKTTTYIVGIALLGMLGISGCTFPHGSNTETVNPGSGYSLEDLEKHIKDESSKDPEIAYKNDKNVDNLYVLVDYLLSDFQYEKAGTYFEELISQTNDRDRARLMKILINDLHPEPGYYDIVDNFLQGYIRSGTIAQDEAIYYGFTLDLLNDKFDKEAINTLTGKYIEFKNQLRRQYDNYLSYKDVSENYLTSLFAVTYFKRQEYGVAKRLAEKVIAKDPNYILPYQLKAYVWLLTKDYASAKWALDTLIQIDTDKLERYQFLLGLINYNNNDLTQAQNYFLQMKSPILRQEGLRYLIDLEKKQKAVSIENGTLKIDSFDNHDKAILRHLEELFSPETNSLSQLKSIDYQTVFDRYIYDRLLVGSGGANTIKKLYLTYPEVFNTALQNCKTHLTGEQFVCQYGEVGKLLIDGKWSEATKVLIPLVKKYPQRQTYYIIGLLYKEQGNIGSARAYFTKALQSIDAKQKSQLSDMLLDMLNTQGATTQ